MIDDVQTEERDDIFHDDELIRSLLNENNADYEESSRDRSCARILHNLLFL